MTCLGAGPVAVRNSTKIDKHFCNPSKARHKKNEQTYSNKNMSYSVQKLSKSICSHGNYLLVNLPLQS